MYQKTTKLGEMDTKNHVNSGNPLRGKSNVSIITCKKAWVFRVNACQT